MPIDLFDWLAPVYDRSARFEPSPGLLEFLALPSAGVLLDIGGGTGRAARTFQSLGQEVLLADPSREMLRRGRARGLASVLARGEELPFPAGRFSRVFMMDAFHHVRDQGQVARELWRMLAPGGRLIVVEPNIRLLRVKAIARLEWLLRMDSHFLTGEGLRLLFSPLGGRVAWLEEGINLLVQVEK